MKRLSTPRWSLVLGAVLLLALAPGLASAARIAIVEPAEDPPTVEVSGFDCGVQTTVAIEYARIEGCWTTPFPPQVIEAIAYMVEEPLDPHPGAISDSLHLSLTIDGAGVAHVVLTFWSDVTGTAKVTPPPGFPSTPEIGALQPINAVFFSLDAAGVPHPVVLPVELLDVWAWSDFGTPVPTRPTTWGALKTLYR